MNNSADKLYAFEKRRRSEHFHFKIEGYQFTCFHICFSEDYESFKFWYYLFKDGKQMKFKAKNENRTGDTLWLFSSIKLNIRQTKKFLKKCIYEVLDGSEIC